MHIAPHGDLSQMAPHILRNAADSGRATHSFISEDALRHDVIRDRRFLFQDRARRSVMID